MSQPCSGDPVEIRPLNEIARTLHDGALDGLPFMPEMLEFCGRGLRVSRRALTTCYFPGSHRGFDSNKIVTLDGVRCSGAAHGGCQKACVIFWREEWLRKIGRETVLKQIDTARIDQFRQELPASDLGDGTYRCQASELPKVSHTIGRSERVSRYLSGWRQGNFDVFQLIRSVAISVFWWTRAKLFGIYARGPHTKGTPTESLNLQPGEWVEVKPLSRILETLDQRGGNRGLYFSPDMARMCGRKFRVRSRLDRVISDGTGYMKQFKNTVSLEGSTCECAYGGFGMADCSRREVTYWREIWLQRCKP
jgi:hypothetical protein